MIYLILAITSSVCLSIVLRISERFRENHLTMFCINYIICFALSLTQMNFRSLQAEPISIGLGSLQGILYLVNFILLQYNISKSGVILSTTFVRLGVLVPTLFSIFLFGEKPTLMQAVGFFLAIAAILFMQRGNRLSEKSTSKTAFQPMLLVLLGVGGVTDILAKVYEEKGPQEYKNVYILSTFLLASIFCIVLAILKKQSLTWKDFLCGVALGVPNYFSAVFLLYSLHDVPAIIVYPTFSVSAIILVSLCGLIFFKEKISRRQFGALGLILVALLLLNI